MTGCTIQPKHALKHNHGHLLFQFFVEVISLDPSQGMKSWEGRVRYLTYPNPAPTLTSGITGLTSPSYRQHQEEHLANIAQMLQKKCYHTGQHIWSLERESTQQIDTDIHTTPN